MEHHHCPYLHTETPIPFRAYPRDLTPTEVAALGDYDENVLYAQEAFALWTRPAASSTAAGGADAQA